MTFEEWAKSSKWNFDSSEHAKEIKEIAKAAWEAGRCEADTVGLRDKLIGRMKAIIADDAWAISFQTMGQYRSAILKILNGL